MTTGGERLAEFCMLTPQSGGGPWCSIEVMESSDISMTDCWNSRGTSPLGLNVPPGSGVGAPTVP